MKSGRSRSFPIHSDLQGVLKRAQRLGAYVFYGPRRGRLKPETVRRILVKEVIEPFSEKFPTPDGEREFNDGRLHSFRHYFCSTCANNGVPERMVMDWLGHADSEAPRSKLRGFLKEEAFMAVVPPYVFSMTAPQFFLV